MAKSSSLICGIVTIMGSVVVIIWSSLSVEYYQAIIHNGKPTNISSIELHKMELDWSVSIIILVFSCLLLIIVTIIMILLNLQRSQT
jgi:hypothetical protein